MSIAPTRPPAPRTLLAACAAALTLLVACNQSPGRTPTPAPTANTPAPAPVASTPVRTQTVFAPAGPSAQVSFTLQGCRNDGSPPLAPTYDPTATPPKLTCPDGAYTTGNLGKGWNELDLVPHRLTVAVGNQDSATTTFSVILAADYQLGGKTGYDVVTLPVINAAKSDASCQITVQDQQTGGSVTGGADTVVYRTVNFTLAKGKTCVIDYTNRLALGAARYSGSSLQAYMFEKSDFSTGKRTIPLPVKEILPQTLGKDMTASQGSDKVWGLTKEPSQSPVNFGDVCAANAPVTRDVDITVRWTVVSTTAGDITYTTHVYASNPASRSVKVTVTDHVYAGQTPTGTALATKTATSTVDANTTMLVLEHTGTLPAGTAAVGDYLNDVATATYTDTLTGVAVPGQTTASAKAQIKQGSVGNATADIADDEWISGAGLTFAAAAPALGAYTNYTAGTFVTGVPTPVNWKVSGQTGSGSVTFRKTIRRAGTSIVTGTLSDTATLSLGGSVAMDTSLGVDVTSTASVRLTITKTIPNVLQAGEGQTFTFVVKNASGTTEATPSISFSAGETTKTVTVDNLDPGTYTVTEDAATGWQAQPAQTASIALPSCSGGVTFDNAVVPARAKVVKTTVPAGAQQGWEFKLLNTVTNVVVATGTTAADGTVSFAGDLAEGSYKVVETAQAGYDLTAQSGCTFTVNYPADAGRTFTCAATNTRRGRIIVQKVTAPSTSTQGFVFTPSYNGGTTFTLKNGESNDSGLLVPGTYSVSEAVPAGWDQTGATCDDGSAVTAIDLGAGETVTCTFTNTQRARLIVDKVTFPSGDAQSFTFTTTGSGYVGFSLTDAAAPNDQSLQPGTYSVTETEPAGWAQTSAVCSDGSPLDKIVLGAGETVTCTVTNTRNATVIVRKVMVGGTGSFTFTGTPSGSIGTSGGTIQASVAPGRYVSTEAPAAGWDLTGIVCDDGDSVASVAGGQATFNARAGETVTCTFTNTRRGSVTVIKDAVPNDAQDFTFTTTGTGLSSFTLDDDSDATLPNTRTFTNLLPGSYGVTEASTAGWALTGLHCTDPSGGTSTAGSSASIGLAPGEHVTCTFTNSRLPKIVVQKNAKPASGSFAFTTGGSGYSGFTLTGSTAGGGNVNTQTVVPGTYTVRESTQLGWILTGIGGSTAVPKACIVTGSGGSSGTGSVSTQTATITVEYGDTVTCVFENTGQGVTRTQGFWATHPQLALVAWTGGPAFGHTFPGVGMTQGIGDQLLCGRPVVAGTYDPAPVAGSSDLMGAFWSGISKTTANRSRSSLDQARMQLLQQMIAAQLNASAFGSVPAGGMGMFAAWEAAYCGTNAAAIGAAQSQAASFNTAGDSGTFTPGTSADSKGARAIANLKRWDSLP